MDKGKFIVKMKKKSRKLLLKSLLFSLGLAIILIGFVGVILSNNSDMYAFLLVSNSFTMSLGILLIFYSFYENENLKCPYCKNSSSANYGILRIVGWFNCRKCRKKFSIN